MSEKNKEVGNRCKNHLNRSEYLVFLDMMKVLMKFKAEIEEFYPS